MVVYGVLVTSGSRGEGTNRSSRTLENGHVETVRRKDAENRIPSARSLRLFVSATRRIHSHSFLMPSAIAQGRTAISTNNGLGTSVEGTSIRYGKACLLLAGRSKTFALSPFAHLQRHLSTTSLSSSSQYTSSSVTGAALRMVCHSLPANSGISPCRFDFNCA